MEVIACLLKINFSLVTHQSIKKFIALCWHTSNQCPFYYFLP